MTYEFSKKPSQRQKQKHKNVNKQKGYSLTRLPPDER